LEKDSDTRTWEAVLIIERADLNEVLLITPEVYTDERGFFMETYNQREFAALGISTEFKQDNFSSSTYGTLRGLHYQLERPQGKLIRVLAGEIYNVGLDARGSSPTFGQWVGCILSAHSRTMMWLPPGFAHGLLALSPVAEIMYKTTDYYHPQSQRSIFWNDPALAIPWPIVEGMEVLLSERDRTAPMFAEAVVF